MTARSRLSTARKEQIVMAYVTVTNGRLPTDLDKLLGDVREMVRDVSEADLRKAIAWALQQTKRPRARIIMQFIRVATHQPEFPV
jgi:hypothetical protein